MVRQDEREEVNDLTSVSSVDSSSAAFGLGDDVEERVHEDVPDEDAGARCKPAFYLSASPHERMVARRLRISKRFPSCLGVVRNWRRTFVTNLLSTLLSV